MAGALNFSLMANPAITVEITVRILEFQKNNPATWFKLVFRLSTPAAMGLRAKAPQEPAATLGPAPPFHTTPRHSTSKKATWNDVDGELSWG